MKLHQYTVTQLRLGATCPRVHYFDAEWTRRHGAPRRRVSLLWKEGAVPAGGALFHRSVERLTRLAATAPAVRAAVEGARTAEALHQALARFFCEACYDPVLADKPVEVQRGFVDALHCYLEELAHLALSARTSGIPAADIVFQLFGDPRKRVDVTFHLQEGHVVRVTGVVDHVFLDWRTGRHRILDYKLTPGHAAHGDLVQVSAYALMHDRQHRTRPDVAVYYLHPERRMVERTWEQVWEDRARIYDHLASMIAWEAYDERTRTGLLPPGDPTLCGGCVWRRECEARLGPRDQGGYARGWTERFERGDRSDPRIVAREPPEVLPEPVIVDRDDGAPPDTAPVAGDAAPEALPDGLWVGFDARGAPVVVPTRALHTHVAVVGAAGSGKTWIGKVLAEEAVRNGIPVIAIDPQGDLVQFLRRRDRSEIPEALAPAWAAFGDRVEPRVYTPGSSHGERLSLDPIRLPVAEDLAGIDDPDRRAEEEEGLIQAVAVNLAALAAVPGDRASQETFLLQVLRSMPRRGEIALADVVRWVRDPAAAGIDDPDALIRANTRTNLALKLNTLVYGPSASLFTGGTPLDLDAMLRPSAPGRVPLNVIYLNAMVNDAQKQFFVASLAAEVYRWMITRASAEGGQTSFLLYLDEARDYIPAGGERTMAKEPLLRLFRQGRKYGVGCLICTQSPRSVDYNAFGNCSSKVIGRLESAQDVERVRQWFTTEAPPAWLGGRKGAEPGSFVARWATDERSTGSGFRGRMLFSAHEGAWSPDRVERETRQARGG